MLYLGLDVHSKWMTIKGFDPETGEEVTIDRLPNDKDSIDRAFADLQGPLHGAMESGTNAWSVYRILETHFEQLYVVDPATVWGGDIRRGAKTDRRDARKLAIKMHRGELQPLYVPDEKTQDLRALGRSKINASRHVTKLVNEIGSLLRSWGIVVEYSLLSVKGQKLIEESKPRLPEHSLKVLELWLDMLNTARKVEAELEKAVRAEVGDVRRFASARQLICYCGLSPSVFASADKVHYGKLNKACNRFLKYVLVLRAQGMSRSKEENPMRQTYWRVFFKSKANHAKIAVARQLARVIYSMLKNKERWNPSKMTKMRGSPASCAT